MTKLYTTEDTRVGKQAYNNIKRMNPHMESKATKGINNVRQ